MDRLAARDRAADLYGRFPEDASRRFLYAAALSLTPDYPGAVRELCRCAEAALAALLKELAFPPVPP